MAKWYVDIDGKYEGPFTSRNLRDALREGDLDPFALITKDPATIPPRPIIDVNEIFESTSNRSQEQEFDLDQTVRLDEPGDYLDPFSRSNSQEGYDQADWLNSPKNSLNANLKADVKVDVSHGYTSGDPPSNMFDQSLEEDQNNGHINKDIIRVRSLNVDDAEHFFTESSGGYIDADDADDAFEKSALEQESLSATIEEHEEHEEHSGPEVQPQGRNLNESKQENQNFQGASQDEPQQYFSSDKARSPARNGLNKSEENNKEDFSEASDEKTKVSERADDSYSGNGFGAGRAYQESPTPRESPAISHNVHDLESQSLSPGQGASGLGAEEFRLGQRESRRRSVKKAPGINNLLVNQALSEGQSRKSASKESLRQKLANKGRDFNKRQLGLRKINAKRKYILLYKKTGYGPFTSAEIVQSYLNGKLEKGTKVRKKDSGATVSVANFVKFYIVKKQQRKVAAEASQIVRQEGARAHLTKMLPPADHGRAFGRSHSKVKKDDWFGLGDLFQGFVHNSDHYFKSVGIGLLILSLIGVGFFAFKKVFPSFSARLSSNQSSQHLRSQQTRLKRVIKSPTRTTSSKNRIEASQKKFAAKPLVRSSKSTKFSVPKKVGASAKKSQYKKPKKSLKPVTRTSVKPLSISRFSEQAEKDFEKLQKQSKASFKNQPSYQSLSSKGVAKGQSNNLLASLRLESKVDQKVTIGPLSYKVSDVVKCGLKCSVIMRDGSGGQITAVFFKAGFEAALRKKRGRAVIVGTVKDRGKSIILQGVQ